MSGNELSWDAVEETVDSQIKVAEASGDGEVLAELKELRSRLNILQRTGAVPEHPAEAYDRLVEAAIQRLLPEAKITREPLRSNVRADFVVRDEGREVLVETKWRPDPARTFGGSTLPQLVERLPHNAKLLVVVNADKSSPRAHEIIADSLAGRGRIIRWQDFRDDSELGTALVELLHRPRT
jgi:hypothetical protein